jgi:hypothetical protein
VPAFTAQAACECCPHFVVNLCGHRGALDGAEPVPREEALLEGQYEQPAQPQRTPLFDQTFNDSVSYTLTYGVRVYRQGANLAQVLPEHVQRAAAHQ